MKEHHLKEHNVFKQSGYFHPDSNNFKSLSRLKLLYDFVNVAQNVTEGK